MQTQQQQAAAQQQQNQHQQQLPATLSPSSWARASVYNPVYGSAYPLAINSGALGASAAGGHPLGRYSDPLSLRGTGLLIRILLALNIFLWLVRDASLVSFVLYSIFVNALVYFLVARGEPFSLAIVVESAASVNLKQNGSQSHAQAPATGFHPMPVVPSQSAPLQSAMRASSLSPPSVPASVSFKTTPSTVKPAGGFGFSAAAMSAAESTASPKQSPTPTQPNFHEQQASGRNLLKPMDSSVAASSMASPSHSPSASSSPPDSLGLPTIDPSNMPQTPSTEPAITPMPSRALMDQSAASSASTNGGLHLPTESTPVVIAGATSRHSSTNAQQCWDRASGSSYEVRIGPNYKKTGKKAPSKPAMFECVGCDVFGAPEGKLEHVAAHLQLPWIAKPQEQKENGAASSDVASSSNGSDGEIPVTYAAVSEASLPEEPAAPLPLDPVTKAWDHYELDPKVLALDEELGVPTLFIINFQIPTYAPGYFSSKEDGEGFSILLYFQITATTRHQIRSGRLPGAVQLFKDFVANAHEFEYHSRFKCIPRIVNPSDANVGMAARSAMRMYNSKPFLTGPHCHAFLRGPGYMEADIDVHRFCLTARKGAYGFLEALNSLIVDIGFVVEGGRDGADDELPEQILGCAHIAHLDPLNAKPLSYYIEVGKQQRAKRMAK